MTHGNQVILSLCARNFNQKKGRFPKATKILELLAIFRVNVYDIIIALRTIEASLLIGNIVKIKVKFTGVGK